MQPKMMTRPVLVMVLPNPPLIKPVSSPTCMPESRPIRMVANTSPTDALHLNLIRTVNRKIMEIRNTTRVFIAISPS